jgi:hypothetical protein
MIGQNVYNRVSDQMDRVGEESKEIVDHYPISSALVAFGLGIGTGVALVAMLCDKEPEYDPGNIAQRLGRQMLEAVSNVIPESLTKKVWG